VTRWLKEPLLHFVVLGIGLFALYGLVSDGSESGGSEDIVVDTRRIAALAEQFVRSWRRPPTAAELDGLIESYVRDEVLYREGLALGLDRDDAVIRSRVRLKMEILGDGPEAEVTEADLAAFFHANADRYAIPARYEVRQVYFDPWRHRAGRIEIPAALRDLDGEPDLDPAALGDSTLLPAVLSNVTRAEVAAQLGEELAVALADAPAGRWFGPVASSYGEHLLRVDLLRAPGAAALTDVRETVERDLRYARAQTARDKLYERLRTGYTVRIDTPAGSDFDAALAEPR
jgi:hypothetical protein